MHTVNIIKSLISIWSKKHANDIFVFWPSDNCSIIIDCITQNPTGLFVVIGFDRPLEECYVELDAWLQKNDHKKNNVFLLNEDFLHTSTWTKQLKCIRPLNACHDLLSNLSFLQEHRYKINEVFRPTNSSLSSQWLMLNRALRNHRTYVYNTWIPKYQQNFVYSYGKDKFFGNINFDDKLTGEMANTMNLLMLKDVYNMTCGSVVVETSVDEFPPLSEKTFHAFLALHPLMIVGVPGIVDYLRKQNFDMFDDLINHSYDKIPDPTLRIDRLFLDNDQIIKNGIDCTRLKSRLLHNRENVWNYYDMQLKTLESSFNAVYLE